MKEAVVSVLCLLVAACAPAKGDVEDIQIERVTDITSIWPGRPPNYVRPTCVRVSAQEEFLLFECLTQQSTCNVLLTDWRGSPRVQMQCHPVRPVRLPER